MLSTMLFLLAILAYVVYTRKADVRRRLIVLFLFGLALMAKPMVVTLPFLLLLIDIWPLGRVKIESGQKAVWIRLFTEKLPLFAMTLVSCIITIFVQGRSGAVAGMTAFPLGARIANAMISYIAYMRDCFWPANLCIFYPPLPDYPIISILFSAVVMAGITLLAIRAVRRHPYFLIGWLWFLGTLLPVIGLIQAGSQSRADRYTYVPLIGIFIIIGWGIPALLNRWKPARLALTAGACSIVFALSAAARNQTEYWRDAESPWKHALESTKDNYFAHVYAGLALEDRGEDDRATEHYRQALQINPDFAVGCNALGAALMKQKQYEPAVGLLRKALLIQPDFVEAESNLGAALMEMGKTDEAMAYLTAAVGIRPDAKAQFNLGMILTRIGRTEEALAHYSEALRINPSFSEAYIQIGNILFRENKPDEAIAEYRKAEKSNPEQSESHYLLGLALMNQGRPDEAIAEYQKALALKPGWADAHNNLGTVLMHQRREKEALEQFQESLRLNPASIEARYNLAIALLNQKQYDEAVDQLREVLRMRPNDEYARNTLALAIKSKSRR